MRPCCLHHPLLTLTLALAALAAGCASTDYVPAGAKREVVQGKGGNRVVVDDMEIWDAEGPPRRYEVIGRVDEERTSGVLPALRSQERAVKLAREAGGNALVAVSSKTERAGYRVLGTGAAGEGQQGPALGTAPAVPLTRHTAAFLVIRYLD